MEIHILSESNVIGLVLLCLRLLLCLPNHLMATLAKVVEVVGMGDLTDRKEPSDLLVQLTPPPGLDPPLGMIPHLPLLQLPIRITNLVPTQIENAPLLDSLISLLQNSHLYTYYLELFSEVWNDVDTSTLPRFDIRRTLRVVDRLRFDLIYISRDRDPIKATAEFIHETIKKKIIVPSQMKISENYQWSYLSKRLSKVVGCPQEMIDYLFVLAQRASMWTSCIPDINMIGRLNLTGLTESVNLTDCGLTREEITQILNLIGTKKKWFVKAILVVARSLVHPREGNWSRGLEVKTLEEWKIMINSPLMEFMSLIYF